MLASSVPQPSYGHRRLLSRLFGVKLVSDIHEHLCDRGVRPPVDNKRRQRLAAIRKAGVLFIHIPKNAGMSISHALYGRQIKHATLRYYSMVVPELLEALPSFAIVREPVQRFLSAYSYALDGGGRDNVVSPPFRPRYTAFRSVDEVLDHLEQARRPYDVDHIFGPQSWYVTDASGSVAVDRLLLLRDIDQLSEVAPRLKMETLSRLNRGRRYEIFLTDEQTSRLHALDRQDFEMVQAARAQSPVRDHPSDPQNADSASDDASQGVQVVARRA